MMIFTICIYSSPNNVESATKVAASQEEGAPEGDPSSVGKMEWWRMWQGWDVETGKWSP
jgi:hypothetical protein